MYLKRTKIRMAAICKGLTISEVAESAGISRQTASKAFNEGNISIATGKKIAEALNIPLEKIVQKRK